VDLKGYLYMPEGNGPAPVVLFNHGAHRTEHCSVAEVFVNKGYIFFVPYRRGHGPSVWKSSGVDPVDSLDALEDTHGKETKEALVMPLLLVSLEDVRAALDYVKTAVPHARKDAIAVAGHSYGGMITLLSAARVNGFKAAVAISPGTLSWKNSPWLQKVLKETAAEVKIPTLSIQSKQECSGSDPTQALKPLLPHNGSDGVLYAYDTGECKKTHAEFLIGAGRALWRNDVRAFLAAHGVAP